MACRDRYTWVLTLASLVLTLAAGWGPAYALADLADPTRPFMAAQPVGGAAPPPPAELVLELTLVSPARRVAMINGRTYEVGGSVGGALIMGIRPYEVILTRGGRATHLRFFPKVTDWSNE